MHSANESENKNKIGIWETETWYTNQTPRQTHIRKHCDHGTLWTKTMMLSYIAMRPNAAMDDDIDSLEENSNMDISKSRQDL